MIGNYDKALEDAQTAIKTDENFMKVGQDPQNIFLISNNQLFVLTIYILASLNTPPKSNSSTKFKYLAINLGN